jgi:uncharacterized protein (DUF924 family)
VARRARDHVREMKQVSWEDVLAFWLGAPATTGPALMHKIQRWYRGTPELDLEIGARFGGLVERALEGAHQDWTETPRGRLALIIATDQFPRNLYRGTRRAYAGDARALTLALDMLERGDTTALGLEGRLFAMMPLVHAENLKLQERSVELAEGLVAAAPSDELRAVWATGAARTKHYREIIGRFGRFPGRNAALGRQSTPQELAFLREEQAASPPPRA